MDKYELEDRAGITLTDEEYTMIETVYLESADFTCVGDVVNYIKAHKGSYKGLLERYADACKIAKIHDNLCREYKDNEAKQRQIESLEKEVARLKAIVEVYRPFVDAQKILETAGLDNVAAMLGQREVA